MVEVCSDTLTAFEMTICIGNVAAEDDLVKEVFCFLIILMPKQ